MRQPFVALDGHETGANVAFSAWSSLWSSSTSSADGAWRNEGLKARRSAAPFMPNFLKWGIMYLPLLKLFWRAIIHASGAAVVVAVAICHARGGWVGA